MEAELGAEIGDQVIRAEAAVGRLRMRQIRVVGRQNPAVAREVALVLGHFLQALLVDLPQQGLRAVTYGQPQVGIEPREQVARGEIPRVPEIVGEFGETREPR